MKKILALRIADRLPEGLAFRVVRITFLLLWLSLSCGLSALGGETMFLRKGWQHNSLKQHPYANQLTKSTDTARVVRGPNYDRLLVILVEFQPEAVDDPNTTGDGRFQSQPDPSYLYSIGSAPHDREYFMANLEALRYYYLAVSCGSYDLSYDVYPDDGSKLVLPHSMGFYNPPGASSTLFTERMEEYFAHSFSLADQQFPQIDFSNYGHYMIIHAGSDWQHDILGDTPSDIPSFFIRVTDDKAVSVDGGTHLIKHACNVPATISQDFSSETTDGVTVHSGYGALNAVIAHEFGHSLGLVDLYNVYNFRPMVGVFDIMDSGGSGILVDQLNDGSLVMVEGILPALPGAFSRTLLFEDWYRANGYLKDVRDVELFTPLPLAASSMKQTGPVSPNIYKVPITGEEYFLVENRSVDPDNDGATAVFGALDGRVVLYPTPLNDPQNLPSYEYDYLLPSFQRPNADAVGGGILVWHVNNDVIYNQGVVYQDGSWASNFNNNTVNTDYHNRGVQVVEADGLADIGNDWSWYWTGTQYEYFHKFRPVLDSGGYFQNWSQSSWKPMLGPNSDPALTSFAGNPSLYWLAGIGNPAAIMSFELRSGFFEGSDTIALENGAVSAPLIDTSFDHAQLPVFGPTGIRLFSTGSSPWSDLMGEFPYTDGTGNYPVTRSEQTPNSYHELVLSMDDRLRIIEFGNDALDMTDIDLGAPPTLQALAYNDKVYTATSDAVFQIGNNAIQGRAEIADARKLAIAGNELLVLTKSGIVFLDLSNLNETRRYTLSGEFGDYEPLVFLNDETNQTIAVLTNNQGDIWSCRNNEVARIFSNNSTALPTQLGITSISGQSPIIFFGLGDQAYALRPDGTYLSGFPYHTDTYDYEAHRHVYSVTLSGDTFMQIPVEAEGYHAVSILPSSVPQNALSLPARLDNDRFYYDGANGILYWYFIDSQANLCYQWMSVEENPVLWAGPRNDGTGQFMGAESHSASTQTALSAYVYPNPVNSSPLRVRAERLDSNPVELKVYDVAGKLVLDKSFAANPLDSRDFQLDHRLSSGVYFLTVGNGSRHTRIKFAVIN